MKIYAEEWKLPVPVVDSYLLTKKDYLVRRDGRCRRQEHPAGRRQRSRRTASSASFDVAKYLDLSYLPK